MKILKQWTLKRDDGNVYIVVKRQHNDGPMFKPLSGPSTRLPGSMDFALADGKVLVDYASGCWEIASMGVKIKQPEDM